MCKPVYRAVAIPSNEPCGLRLRAVPLAALVFVIAACGGGPSSPTPEPSYSIEYQLSSINAGHRTDETEERFRVVLDCVQRAYPEETRQRVADVLVSSWQARGDAAEETTLLEWSEILCSEE
jgi:hypothetical protein